jgi:hypothetical protein
MNKCQHMCVCVYIEEHAYSYCHSFRHNREHPYFYALCNKSFGCKDAVKIHHCTHRAEQRFSCVTNDKSFCSKFNLKTLKQIHSK